MQDEILAAIKKVVANGQFILGQEVKGFEKEFADFCDVGHCVGVGNGTEALYLAMKALNIGSGDEVITVSHTASATICAIKMTGARPVFIDIEENSYLMNPGLISEKITFRTKAIMPVHLYGRQCDMKSIMRIADIFGLWVIEDCCQSVDSGPLHGDFGCYSFYPTKNLGGVGDGGCVIMRHEGLANKIRRMREYGYGQRFVSCFMGINSRLDEIQAAVLRVKLKYAKEETSRRRKLAELYISRLKDTSLILPEYEGVFHQFVARYVNRDELVNMLNLQIHYPVPCHLQPAYKDYSTLPITEIICKQILSLPMRIDIAEAESVCQKIRAII